MSGDLPDFEEVWRGILRIARRLGTIRTLDLGVNNEIAEVNPTEIIVISERTGKRRPIGKRDVESDWRILANRGSLRSGEEASWHGAIVAAFLAQLPYVTYTLNPRTLWIRTNVQLREDRAK